MSDFFASLLGRAQQRAPLLQRRQPSMFEAADTNNPMPNLEGMLETPASPRASQFFAPPVVQPSPVARPIPAPAVFAAPAMPPVATTENPATARPSVQTVFLPQAPQISSRHDLQASAPVASTHHTHHTESIERIETLRETREIHHQHVAPAVVPRSNPPISASLPTRVPVQNVVLNPAQAKLSTIRVEPGAPNSKTASKTASNTPAEQANTKAHLQRQPSAPPISQPSRPATWRGQRQVAPAAPAPLPTIQVAIGRIEIKASPAATQATRPASRPAGPKLTLDDYLRSQSGGRK